MVEEEFPFAKVWRETHILISEELHIKCNVPSSFPLPINNQVDHSPDFQEALHLSNASLMALDSCTLSGGQMTPLNWVKPCDIALRTGLIVIDIP